MNDMHTFGRLLFAEQSGGLSVGEKVTTSLQTLVLGMLVVFSVLLIIMLVITIVGRIFKAVDKKKAVHKEAVPSAPVDVPVDQPEETAFDEGELIAAITAAVALCMEAEPGSFRVVSFKKTNAKSAWNRK